MKIDSSYIGNEDNLYILCVMIVIVMAFYVTMEAFKSLAFNIKVRI